MIVLLPEPPLVDAIVIVFMIASRLCGHTIYQLAATMCRVDSSYCQTIQLFLDSSYPESVRRRLARCPRALPEGVRADVQTPDTQEEAGGGVAGLPRHGAADPEMHIV
jgi:hypothetical protein